MRRRRCSRHRRSRVEAVIRSFGADEEAIQVVLDERRATCQHISLEGDPVEGAEDRVFSVVDFRGFFHADNGANDRTKNKQTRARPVIDTAPFRGESPHLQQRLAEF